MLPRRPRLVWCSDRTEVLIFGTPRPGTLLTWLAYNDVQWSAQRHCVDAGLDRTRHAMVDALAAAATEAAAASVGDSKLKSSIRPKVYHRKKCPGRRDEFTKILMVLTSHEKLGNTGRKADFWLEEFATPCYTFKDAGAEIVLASPKGGQPPLDPKSNEPNFRTDLTHRFEGDADAKAQLATTLRLDSVKAEDYDTVFYPGGHGTMCS